MNIKKMIAALGGWIILVALINGAILVGAIWLVVTVLRKMGVIA